MGIKSFGQGLSMLLTRLSLILYALLLDRESRIPSKWKWKSSFRESSWKSCWVRESSPQWVSSKQPRGRVWITHQSSLWISRKVPVSYFSWISSISQVPNAICMVSKDTFLIDAKIMLNHERYSK